MKNITKLLMAFLCLGVLFTACNKDNIDYDALNRQQIEAARKEKARRDSLLRIQAPLLEQCTVFRLYRNLVQSRACNR